MGQVGMWSVSGTSWKGFWVVYFPKFNELLCRMEYVTSLQNTLCLIELPSKIEGFSSEEIVIQQIPFTLLPEKNRYKSNKISDENYKPLMKEIKEVSKCRHITCSCSWIGRLNTGTSVLLDLIYRSTGIPAKVFVDIGKFIVKFTIRGQKSRIATTILKKGWYYPNSRLSIKS